MVLKVNNETDSWLQEAFALFTKEEWTAWTKGEVNLFDLYVERVGMSDEDAQRLRDRICEPVKKNDLTKRQVDTILEPRCEK